MAASSSTAAAAAAYAPFGAGTPFCEPAWYQGFPTHHYSPAHVVYRALARAFVEEKILPYVDEWIDSDAGYPASLHRDLYQVGLSGALFPQAPEFGGDPSADQFHELIFIDEVSRSCGGNVPSQVGIHGMALPPLLKFANQHVKDKVVRAVITGEKSICLAISEAHAGSDVAGIRCSAARVSRDGTDFFRVNGQKKWITGGHFADYFTTCVRAGGGGRGGISVLLVDRHLPGVSVRKMQTQFDSAHSTTFVTFDTGMVPVDHLVHRENEGFKVLLVNFNHERWIIAVEAVRYARRCYELSFAYALRRKTFGKPLMSSQVVRAKLADMVRGVETTFLQLEQIASLGAAGVPDAALGGICALTKVNASRTFELCAREAAQIFGGAAVVREGSGKLVERMYRIVRQMAIPGGSEEILTDFAIRFAVKQAKL